MKKRIIFLILFFYACDGDAVSESDLDQICDGSDELVLVIRQDGNGHNLYPNAFLFLENGLPFIHINGKCEFWLGGHDDVQTFNHLTFKHGQLSNEQGLELLEVLEFPSWKELNNTRKYSSGAGGDNLIKLSSTNINFGFSSVATQNDAVRKEFKEGFYSALKYLEKLGTPIESGDFRIYISPGLASNNSFWSDVYGPVFQTTLPLEIEQISKNQIPICFGGTFLVTGDQADSLRVEQDKFRIFSESEFEPRMVLERDEIKYELFVRDVLPYENENGLVLFRGDSNPDVCWSQ